MNRKAYYRDMQALALEVRKRHGLTRADISIKQMWKVYRAEGIERIDFWPNLKRIRAAYFNDECGVSVMLARGLPDEPTIFSVAHELKHHLVDQAVAKERALGCGGEVSWQSGSPLEIGAEVFAAEFIWPENEFLALANEQGVSGVWRAEDVVRLKRAAPAPVSYTFIQKRLRWFGLTAGEQFKGVQFQKLEERLYGRPFYKYSTV